MSVKYNKLWKLLIDHNMSRVDLKIAAQMSPNIKNFSCGEIEIPLDEKHVQNGYHCFLLKHNQYFSRKWYTSSLNGILI